MDYVTFWPYLHSLVHSAPPLLPPSLPPNSVRKPPPPPNSARLPGLARSQSHEETFGSSPTSPPSTLASPQTIPSLSTSHINHTGPVAGNSPLLPPTAHSRNGSASSKINVHALSGTSPSAGSKSVLQSKSNDNMLISIPTTSLAEAQRIAGVSASAIAAAGSSSNINSSSALGSNPPRQGLFSKISSAVQGSLTLCRPFDVNSSYRLSRVPLLFRELLIVCAFLRHSQTSCHRRKRLKSRRHSSSDTPCMLASYQRRESSR